MRIEWGNLAPTGCELYGPLSIGTEWRGALRVLCGCCHPGTGYSSGLDGWCYCMVTDIAASEDREALAQNILALAEARFPS